MDFGNIYPRGANGTATQIQSTNPAAPSLQASAAYNVGGSASVAASGVGASMWIALAVVASLILLNAKGG